MEFVFRLQIRFNRYDSTDLLLAFISRKNNVILWKTFVEIVVAEKIDTLEKREEKHMDFRKLRELRDLTKFQIRVSRV